MFSACLCFFVDSRSCWVCRVFFVCALFSPLCPPPASPLKNEGLRSPASTRSVVTAPSHNISSSCGQPWQVSRPRLPQLQVSVPCVFLFPLCSILPPQASCPCLVLLPAIAAMIGTCGTSLARVAFVAAPTTTSIPCCVHCPQTSTPAIPSIGTRCDDTCRDDCSTICMRS